MEKSIQPLQEESYMANSSPDFKTKFDSTVTSGIGLLEKDESKI
jgi:hypothetical protein